MIQNFAFDLFQWRFSKTTTQDRSHTTEKLSDVIAKPWPSQNSFIQNMIARSMYYVKYTERAEGVMYLVVWTEFAWTIVKIVKCPSYMDTAPSPFNYLNQVQWKAKTIHMKHIM